MWAVAYLSLMQPGLVVGEVLFVATLFCLFAGGFVAGRSLSLDEGAVLAGAKVGLLTAALNLLIAGSLLVDPQTKSVRADAVLWILGNFGVSIFLASVGAIVGGALMAQSDRAKPQAAWNWFYGFTVVAAATVFLLLITGGLVTGLKAGLAVPDWPNSFGHNMLLYPLSEMKGGVYYEHAHRLYGMLVGVTAITLVIAAFMFDQRGWFRTLAVTYLLMVCVQGYMGGRRVTEISTALAVVHGMFGQVVFAAITCIAAFASTTWKNGMPAFSSDLKNQLKWSAALTVLLMVQLGLGATYRHLQRVLEDPPQPLNLLYTHILVALFVTLLVIFVAGRAWGRHREQPVLPAIGRVLLVLVGVQLALGTAAMVAVWMSQPHQPPPVWEVAITTAHQINGALLLAFSALLTIWTWRGTSQSQSQPLANPLTD